MAEPPPEAERASEARIAQAAAFVAGHRDRFSEQALHEQLRQAGYSEQEISLAFGRLAAAAPPAPASAGAGFGIGIVVALVNLFLFPVAIVATYGLGGSRVAAWAVWLVLGLILLAEASLIYLSNRGRPLGWGWLLALLAPIALQLLYVGSCLSGGIWSV